ncbi:MAG: tetratricopeptide repeat protein [Coriobacteriales bacterium]|nr:tetratricopeptide repeat protein [Coriobacteriales bacterium]
MQSTSYEQATTDYNAGDYPHALKGYYQCLKEDWSSFQPGDAGLVYHRIGNCLIKMRNFKEAAVSYQKALQDDDYFEKTSIYVNLGTTFNGIGKYPEAIACFEKALTDASYATPHRAYMGMGNAYAKLGKYVDAGTAYRKAALDESNPNPVKALMSLASSFSSLGRPDDAVEAYLAILDFRVTGKVLNTVLERLGQAYVVAGRYQEGLETFADALAREQFTLSPEAEADYRKARLALGIVADPEPLPASQAALEEDDSLSGFDLRERFSSNPVGHYSALDFNEDDDFGTGNVPHPGDTGFFTATDADLIATGKREMRRERKLRHTGLKAFFVILLILIVALGVCVVAYYQGVGIPSQEKVVTDFFSAYAAGEPVEEFWVISSDADRTTLARFLDGVARSSNVNIIAIDSQMRESQVLADVKLSEGGTVHYRIDLVRDVIGWKMRGIEMVFASVG